MLDLENLLSELESRRKELLIEQRRVEEELKRVTDTVEALSNLNGNPKHLVTKGGKGLPLQPFIKDVLQEAGDTFLSAEEVAQRVLDKGYPVSLLRGRSIKSRVQPLLSNWASLGGLEKEYILGVMHYRAAQQTTEK